MKNDLKSSNKKQTVNIDTIASSPELNAKLKLCFRELRKLKIQEDVIKDTIADMFKANAEDLNADIKLLRKLFQVYHLDSGQKVIDENERFNFAIEKLCIDK